MEIDSIAADGIDVNTDAETDASAAWIHVDTDAENFETDSIAAVENAHTMKLLSIEANITQLTEEAATKKKEGAPGIKWLIVRNSISLCHHKVLTDSGMPDERRAWCGWQYAMAGHEFVPKLSSNWAELSPRCWPADRPHLKALASPS